MHEEDENEDLEYLERLDAFFDGREQTTLYFELEQRSLAPDLSDDLTDEDVSRALTNLIWSLADLHVYIDNTDHLSDRDLYDQLLAYCDEPTACIVGIPGGATHWSPIGSWNEEDFDIWLRFYATKEQREEHVQANPGYLLPSSELPPYPRPWIPVRVWEFEE